ncbi:MAG: FAD-dependent oxidoreductase, partial [Gammaproteobacteria bacterium]|nr:FAD-dependent oxidoreductase [Gammaproteobacteria bacterium]
MIYDYIIIGGGIVGVSTAWQLQQRFPGKKILLLEKESAYSRHQTGHNSGVIHAGVYYAPGSLKSKLCKAGVAATIEFCDKNDVLYERCGKLLVATNELEMERMHALFERCQRNEIDVELIGAEQLKSREPNIVGLGGIFVKETAIVNFQQVT